MNIERRVPCEVFTRVVGFYRPVSQFNRGKKEEFSERVTYKIPSVFPASKIIQEVSREHLD